MAILLQRSRSRIPAVCLGAAVQLRVPEHRSPLGRPNFTFATGPRRNAGEALRPRQDEHGGHLQRQLRA